MLTSADHALVPLWKAEMLFTWQWWVLAGLMILPWVFWYFHRKPALMGASLSAGLAFSAGGTFLDHLGTAYGAWAYPIKLIPLIPPLVPWDFSLIPVTAMVFYENWTGIKPVYKAVIFAVLGSFIVQPAATWALMYEPKQWHHWYSFPIFCLMYLGGYALYQWILREQKMGGGNGTSQRDERKLVS